ncbi:uncharacterized protein [Penaeus vannamei]|uniref:uncharacterized protein n=1 Tax=Penaeus vannamei TaxID=6689 RepID=UPI00387F3908
MKNGKTTGPDLIPVEAWKVIGEDGVDILYYLMVKILEQGKISEELREIMLVMEKFREKERDLHVVFIDLEKVSDRVPRQKIRRSLREKVPEKYVGMLQEMYRNATTRVRSTVGETDGFDVDVGLYQGSVFNPFTFNIVMDVITRI